ncbi:Hypothetical predicted protein [Mytilus galloprovincialis]|uniref:Uncharacterized protein n=1 Tax=Mytilus galloprovincialis TaxID=29158 RepID=A0A8B6BTC5_MYTGA|nr:Hypothetical predicted protein [Mytilus galloprovincialis]
MDEFSNYRLCTNVAGQYVNNLMTSNGHVPVSTFNYNIASPSERKRQSDQMAEHYIESDNINKKSRCDLSYSSAPSAIDSEHSQNRLESLILQLSANFTSMSKSLEKRIDDLKTDMEEKISVKVSERIMPLETRNFQNAMRTVLKEMGKDKDYKFVGSRLLSKRT